MKTTVQTSRGPVRFHSVGEAIAGIPTQPLAAGEAAHTPTLCLVGSPASGLAIHAEISGFGHSDPLAQIVIKSPQSAQEFGERVIRACNSFASNQAKIAALVGAMEGIADYAAHCKGTDIERAGYLARAALAQAKQGGAA